MTESDGVVVIDEYSGPAVYLLNEYCVNSSLSKMLIRTGPLEERIARFYFIQLLSAVWYWKSLFLALQKNLNFIRSTTTAIFTNNLNSVYLYL